MLDVFRVSAGRGMRTPLRRRSGRNRTTVATYIVDGVEPALVLDLGAGFYGSRPLGVSDFVVDGVEPALVLDLGNDFYGSRPLDVSDYLVDGISPKLLIDLNNNFFGLEA